MAVLHMRTFLLVGVFIVLWGCGKSEQHYDFEGRVVSKVAETHTLVVDHGIIPGFMPAMTMPYPVASGVDISKVEAGDRIKARVVVRGGDKYELDRVTVTDSSQRGKMTEDTGQLYPGEVIPDIPLTDQDGKAVRLSDFRGKTVLLTFIYTRCPMPNFCPRLSSLFAAVHKELAKDPKEYARTHLLSVSIDPKFDTPAVLHKYGLAYLSGDPKGFEQWSFTVPTEANLRKLAEAFALIYEEQDNQISHSMSTVVIDPKGRLIKEWTASDWTTPEALKEMRQVENVAN
ncbi:MAG TPA: SCO family protein [Candidatus Sulfotelmatobacter sp.]|nr:SCO family protein [Candidatus Sulfotelmatobacter sp.]